MPLVVEHGDGEDIILGKKCIACQLPCSYPAYSCTTHLCLNFFHKSCVDKLPQKIQHPFHSHKPLTLKFSNLQCDLCYKKDCRLVFSCREIGCTFKVCTECAFLDAIIVRCRSHDHLLCLVEGAYFDNIKCDACQKSYIELNNHATSEIHSTRAFLFRCMECDFNLHFICGPLPSTIKFNYHIHSLTFLNSVVEDNCYEYYCDVCEEERNPDFRIYSCFNCRYEAHIHCLIAQVRNCIN
ncbi:protein VACUOLELESS GAMETOPHYTES-like [Humulus lupulus]|uniref:protein VACUOLELESS GAMETOPHYTES-like n=1 Tax=Humulus lupulus TaxID=3486 RepID=UPI002B40F1BD|nr:protein VACUOLELESS GAMETOPHYTES-like [Humulus lupulus]